MRWIHGLALLLLAGSFAWGAEFDTLHTPIRDDPLPPFSLINQHGETVSRDDLRGRIVVVNFFFSRCAGECNVIMPNLERLHRELANWPDVVFVSISVFPTQDTPDRLREYAHERLKDPDRWHLLTGEESRVFDLTRAGFKQGVEKLSNAQPGAEVDHTFRVLLFDQFGMSRGYINDGRDASEVARLGSRVKQLVLAKYFPRLNAGLNATAGVLLLLGYVAVRQRWLTLHKGLMLGAFGTSALFLGCYLFYHFAVLQGQPTAFTGTGWLRPAYFAILLSHTLLAALVAPLALLVTFRGLRGQLAAHRRLARWTLPIWLYVSATGVVVYFLLYHLYPPG